MVEYPGIEMQIERTELSLEKVGEITTGIVIDVTIGTVAMTVIVIEIMTTPVAKIQEGTDLVPGSTGIAECLFVCIKKFPFLFV
jgi:hypothetical protein